jgi:acyl-coenzyme A thioesterase PaaI-like protein
MVASPFADLIGPISVRWEPVPTFRVEVSPSCANTMGRMHGGFVAALFDVCVGQGVRRMNNDGRSLVTLSTYVEYFGAAQVGDCVEVVVAIDRVTSTVVFATGIASVGGKQTAKASVVFSSREAR